MAETDIIVLIINTVITAVATFFLTWGVFKRKLHTIREAIDTLDDALYDNKITEDEFRAIWEKSKKIVRG
jgi:uncharacterized ion transporter superfamily protein YfcC